MRVLNHNPLDGRYTEYRHDQSVIELILDVLRYESREFRHGRLPRTGRRWTKTLYNSLTV